MKSQPGHVYLETLKTLKDMLSDLESKAQASLDVLNEPAEVEKALQEKKALEKILEDKKPTLFKLAEETKALEKNVSPDVGKMYNQECNDVQGKWNKAKVKVSKDLHLLEEIIPKLRAFETDLKVIEKWIEGAKDFLMEEQAVPGNDEGLERQFDQCSAFVKKIDTVESSLKNMKEVETHLPSCPVAGINTRVQTKLVDYQTQLEKYSKEISSHKDKLAERQEKVKNLKKDLKEMQEWMMEVEDEYLDKSFEYKSPEELLKDVEEMQRAKEDVLQKEVRVNILKNNIKLIAKKEPYIGQELTSRLKVELENYQHLCKRIRGKCQALEVCYFFFFSDVFLRLKLCNVLTISISWETKLDFFPQTLHHKGK
ncbi:utrophin-like [Pipistrellus kuhlii]|uniref:utrophin-like n=1 Tax=Pipistrellus kuhlii TaxID=59472 RepID=UPI001E26EC13|nr:utrophin-like [Pipistrellus kuhlii]